jgi:hypothetical protein
VELQISPAQLRGLGFVGVLLELLQLKPVPSSTTTTSSNKALTVLCLLFLAIAALLPFPLSGRGGEGFTDGVHGAVWFGRLQESFRSGACAWHQAVVVFIYIVFTLLPGYCGGEGKKEEQTRQEASSLIIKCGCCSHGGSFAALINLAGREGGEVEKSNKMAFGLD